MFVISAASALNIGAVVRTPAVQRGNRPLLMSSVDEAERANLQAALDEADLDGVVAPTSDSPFTLQERGDGWDDVRGAIADAKKDREKPWAEIKKDYVEPAAEVAQTVGAFASALGSAVGELVGAAAEAADVELPELPVPEMPSAVAAVEAPKEEEEEEAVVERAAKEPPKFTAAKTGESGNFYDLFDLPGKLLDMAPKLSLSGPLLALAFVAAPVGVLTLLVLVLEFGTPGTQTPFNFLDQFYPPAIETKRVDEQKVAALKAKAEAEKAEAEAKAKAAADAEAKAKADAAEGAAV